MEGSHSYQLDSQPGHSLGAGSRSGITEIAQANDAAWGSKERIITGSEHKSGSDGYEVSLPDSDKTLPLQGISRPDAREDPSSQEGRYHSGASEGEDNDRIVVTTEYTVSVAPEQRQGSGAANKSGAW